MTQRRVIFDIGTLVRSKGHSDGITRTVRALARYAAEHRNDVVFAIFNAETSAFHPVTPKCIGPILDGAKVDTSHIPDPFAAKPRFRERLPEPLKRIALVIQRPRRRAFLLTERIRLRMSHSSPLLDRLQEFLLTEKYRAELAGENGKRRWLLPYDVAFGPQLDLTHNDVVLITGSDWSVLFRVGPRIRELNAPRLAILCHDIIPIMFPDFFKPADARNFRVCFEALFPAADLAIFTSRRVRDDVRAYCEAHQLGLGKTAVVPLGADFSRTTIDSRVQLPRGLSPGKYAIFVSTLEPRKNHMLLFRVWQRLIAAGVPQGSGFRLVFVGREGWLMKDALAEMKQDPCFGDSLLLLSDVDDRMLGALYSNAAFCLYPSLYEGFGLPVIEAFHFGKAVLASTAGALPEVIGEFSQCLDPTDVEAWTQALRTWIEDPAARKPYEDAIRNDFHSRDWNEAGRDLFAAVDGMFASEDAPRAVGPT